MAFSAKLEVDEKIAKIFLKDQLDASVAGEFKQAVEEAATHHPEKLVFFMNELSFMASAGLRVLIYAKQKMGSGVSVHIVGARGPVLRTLEMSGFQHAVYLQDEFTG